MVKLYTTHIIKTKEREKIGHKFNILTKHFIKIKYKNKMNLWGRKNKLKKMDKGLHAI